MTALCALHGVMALCSAWIYVAERGLNCEARC